MRFHKKFHANSHHSLSSTGYDDSASDPIASQNHPFQGDFYLAGTLSSENITVEDVISELGVETLSSTNFTADEIDVGNITIAGTISGTIDAGTLDGYDSSAFIMSTTKGQANGVAPLDDNSLIDSGYLPSLTSDYLGSLPASSYLDTTDQTYLLSRSNHTDTQPLSTVDDLQLRLDEKKQKSGVILDDTVITLNFQPIGVKNFSLYIESEIISWPSGTYNIILSNTNESVTRFFISPTDTGIYVDIGGFNYFSSYPTGISKTDVKTIYISANRTSSLLIYVNGIATPEIDMSDSMAVDLGDGSDGTGTIGSSNGGIIRISSFALYNTVLTDDQRTFLLRQGADALAAKWTGLQNGVISNLSMGDPVNSSTTPYDNFLSSGSDGFEADVNSSVYGVANAGWVFDSPLTKGDLITITGNMVYNSGNNCLFKLGDNEFNNLANGFDIIPSGNFSITVYCDGTATESLVVVSESEEWPIDFEITGVSVSNAGCLIHLPFNELSGTVLYDTTTNGENATLPLDGEWVEPINKRIETAIALNTVKRSYPLVDETKLSGIAVGATSNESDAYLLDLANHTGTLSLNNIEGLSGNIEVVETGDDSGVNFFTELHVGQPGIGKESVFGEGDSYPIPYVWHVDYDNISGTTVLSATSLTSELQSDSGSTVGLFGSTDAGKCVLVMGKERYGGVKAKMSLSGTVEPENITAEYLQDNALTWVNAPFMATDADYPYTQNGWTLAACSSCSEQWRFGFNPLSSPPVWDDVTLNVNGVDYTGKWSLFRTTSAISVDPTIEQLKLHTNRMEINADGSTEYFGRARYPKDINIIKYHNSDKNPANENIDLAAGITMVKTDNEFQATADDGLILYGVITEGLDTSIPLTIMIDWAPMGSGSGDVILEAEIVKIHTDFVFDGTATATAAAPVTTSLDGNENERQTSIFQFMVNDLIPGDQFAISLFRDGATNASDTFGSNIKIVNYRTIAYHWRP